MRDPYPVGPPEWLMRAVKPTADALGLYALPLHVHEILLTAISYTIVCNIISPWLSTLLCPNSYPRLSSRTRLNWDVHVVSFVQSVVICAVSFWILVNDQERKRWGYGEAGQLRAWGYYGSGSMCQAFALGYFLWDLYMCARHPEIFGLGMLAHALSAVFVYMAGYIPFMTFYAPNFLLYELSSPFLNIHWFCDKLDLTGSIYQAVNGAFLTTVFFSCRIVWGFYSSYLVFNDMYYAFMKDQFSATVIATGPPSLDELHAIYANPISQQTAFNVGRQLPKWLPLFYLVSNTTLNILNVFWFGKMVQTIRARFDPPLGTRGTGKAKVTYEPATADGEVSTPKQVRTEAITIERAVYADDHSGLEVTGSVRKSVRSRRKA